MKYLDRLIQEKNIDLDEVFSFEYENVHHIFDYRAVVNAIKTAPKEEQVQIRHMFAEIDFRNGDVKHYLRHLAQALV